MKKNFLIITIMVLITATIYSESKFTGGSFSDSYDSTKAAGLGGAFTALANDANAAIYNPAAMALFDPRTKNLSLTYIPSLYELSSAGKISKYLIDYAQGDMSGYGALGAAVNYTTVNIAGDFEGDIDNSWNEYVILVSWAIQIDKYIGLQKYRYPKLSLGLNAKYMAVNSSLTLSGQKLGASGYGVDVALMFAVKENLNLGIMGQNVYSQLNWNGGLKELLPYSIRGGFYYGITNNFLISGEVKLLENDTGSPEIEVYNVGIEYAIDFNKNDQIQKIALRGGVSIDQKNDAYIIAAGTSLFMESFSIDYTYQQYLKILLSNSIHRFGVTMSF